MCLKLRVGFLRILKITTLGETISRGFRNDAQQWKVILYATIRLRCVHGDFEKQPSLAIGTYYAIKDLNPTKREAGKATDFVRSKTLALLKFNADRICKNVKKPLRTHLALSDDELGWY